MANFKESYSVYYCSCKEHLLVLDLESYSDGDFGLDISIATKQYGVKPYPFLYRFRRAWEMVRYGRMFSESIYIDNFNILDDLITDLLNARSDIYLKRKKN